MIRQRRLVGRGALKAGKDGKHTAAMYIPALKKTERVYVLTPSGLDPNLKPEDADTGREYF